MKSHLERDFLYLVLSEGFPRPEREYRFCPSRFWRFDFAWVDKKVAVEISGGIWTRGKHNRGKGMLNDMEKVNAAVTMGWKVLTYAGDNMGNAIKDLKGLL